MKRHEKGFTLSELMIVITFAGAGALGVAFTYTLFKLALAGIHWLNTCGG